MKHWLTVIVRMDTSLPDANLKTIIEDGAEVQNYSLSEMEVTESLADMAFKLKKE